MAALVSENHFRNANIPNPINAPVPNIARMYCFFSASATAVASALVGGDGQLLQVLPKAAAEGQLRMNAISRWRTMGISVPQA
jgi:hypothetical protein